MSRTEEVNKMTENVYKVWFYIQFSIKYAWIVPLFEYLYCHQGILDQFNPSLKNFVAMGKHYEKALTGQSQVSLRFMDKKGKFPLNFSPFLRSNRGC